MTDTQIREGLVVGDIVYVERDGLDALVAEATHYRAALQNIAHLCDAEPMLRVEGMAAIGAIRMAANAALVAK